MPGSGKRPPFPTESKAPANILQNFRGARKVIWSRELHIPTIQFINAANWSLELWLGLKLGDPWFYLRLLQQRRPHDLGLLRSIAHRRPGPCDVAESTLAGKTAQPTPWTGGCVSKIGTQNGTLANGTKHYSTPDCTISGWCSAGNVEINPGIPLEETTRDGSEGSFPHFLLSTSKFLFVSRPDVVWQLHD